MRARTVGLVLGVAVALMAALPVTANAAPRDGDHINLLSPPTTVAANAPFWVGHGWCSTLEDEDALHLIVNPGTRFELAVDGTPISMNTDLMVNVAFPDPDGCVALKVNYHNFRNGLASGGHTFTGCWYLLDELQSCAEVTVSFA